ncbi:MAG: phosphoadenylyl-sulfate reductase [Planctomycetes bacterium]|nr:phosphoadenylyl-sulfate reductase [Planctomycetota bacterium]
MGTQAWTVEQADLSRLEALEPEELLRYALEAFGSRAAIGTSLQKTGVVLIDMASRLAVPYRTFFVDTLMNPPETYALLEAVESRYGVAIERYEPDAAEVEEMHRSVGRYAHFLARSHCCHVRKVRPLSRALETLDVWIAGLRAEQSDLRRGAAARVCIERGPHGKDVLKLNPLFDWTDEQVDAYIRRRDVPCNSLYDYVSAYGERYFVLGCEPCHIPVREALGRRAGKFPWERGSKECGLHSHGSGI